MRDTKDAFIGTGLSQPLLRALALSLLSSALMILAIPNELLKHGSSLLGFIALAPLYISLLLTGAEGKSPMRKSHSPHPGIGAFLVGIFGALQHAGTSFWLWNFHDYRFWTLGSTTIAYFLVYAVLGLYIWLFLNKSGKARPLAFALLWTGFEYLKSTGFLAYPWGLLPYSLTDCLPLLQIADITGVYGITLVLALFNAMIAEYTIACIWNRPMQHRGFTLISSPAIKAVPSSTRRIYSTLALVLLLGDLGYGIVQLGRTPPKVADISAVIVQPNADPWENGDEDTDISTSVALANKAIAQAASKPELVIFNETTLHRPFVEFRDYFEKHPADESLVDFIKTNNIWLFTGAPIVLDWKNMTITNSAILIDPEAVQRGSYAKIHLVPFAEVIPFWDIPVFRTFMQKVVGIDGGWAEGKDYTIFALPSSGGMIRFGAPICFEDAFPDLCRELSSRGADILVNVTNMSWSLTDSAEIQHWASARFRAIESRKTLVRSTNGGVSCVVGPHGETLASLPLFTSTAASVNLPVYREARQTLYIQWGDWLPWASLLLSAALTLILCSGAWTGVAKTRRRRS